MNTDFRVSVDFFTHHKAKKLRKRLGAAALLSLLQLWAYAAKVRTDGSLSGMTAEDIELAAEWEGEDDAFCAALLEIGFLDQDAGGFSLHDWKEEQKHPGFLFRLPVRLDVPLSKWRQLRSAIFERDDKICRYCGAKVDSPDCDHVVPLSRGGKSEEANLVTACPSCNRSKGAKNLEDWLQ